MERRYSRCPDEDATAKKYFRKPPPTLSTRGAHPDNRVRTKSYCATNRWVMLSRLRSFCPDVTREADLSCLQRANRDETGLTCAGSRFYKFRVLQSPLHNYYLAWKTLCHVIVLTVCNFGWFAFVFKRKKEKQKRYLRRTLSSRRLRGRFLINERLVFQREYIIHFRTSLRTASLIDQSCLIGRLEIDLENESRIILTPGCTCASFARQLRPWHERGARGANRLFRRTRE